MGVKGLMGRFFKSRVSSSGRDSTETGKQGYKGGILNALPEDISVLTLDIDANFIFYLAVSYAYGLGDYKNDDAYMRKIRAMLPEKRDERCFQLIEKIFIYIIREIKPRHAVTINIDGAVPMTKISQQRPRRYVTALDVKSDDLFNTCYITPGTAWMNALDRFFTKALTRIQKYMVENGFGEYLVYSSHLVPGEGEHKLFKRMKATRDRYAEMDGIRVIFGGDTDLILLSMISEIDRLYVMTDMYVEFEDHNESIMKVKANQHTEPSVINIDVIKNGISYELGRRDGVVNDFVFIISLVGNDFIPRLPSMNALIEGIDSMMNAMKLMKISLLNPRTKTINWIEVLKLLEIIYAGDAGKKIYSAADRISIYNKSIGKNKAPWRPYQNALEETSDKANTVEFAKRFREAWYLNSLGPRNPDLYEFEDIEIATEDITKMCIDYLFGMNWTSKYYFYGSDAVTWAWFYPYYYSPMLEDLIKVLRQLLEIENGLDLLDYRPRPNEIRITPLHQMVAVIPPIAINKVPPQIKRLWDDSSILNRWMPSGIIIDQDGNRPHPDNTFYQGMYVRDDRGEDSWQGTVILECMSYDMLIYAIDSLKIDPMISDIYAFKDDKQYGSFLAEPSRGLVATPKTRYQLNPYVKKKSSSNERGRGSDRGGSRGGGRGRGEAPRGGRGKESLLKIYK